MPKRIVTIIFVLENASDKEIEEFIQKAKQLSGKVIEVHKVEGII